MRHRALPALLGGLLLSSVSAGAQAVRTDSALARADTVPLALRERIAAELDSVARNKFAHWEGAPGLDYARAFREYRATARATRDRFAFDTLTLAFVAGLRNGHTSFNDPWLRERHGAELGFSLVPAGGRWVVDASRVAGLGVGSVVEAIDGQPFEAFFQARKRYVAASGERMARHVFTYRPYLFPPRFTLALGDGRRVTVTRGEAPPEAEADTSEWAPHRWLVADSVGYLRVAGFDPPRHEERALEVLPGFLRAAVLVVDVRGNGGGSTPWQLEKALTGQVREWTTVRDLVRPSPADSAAWEQAKADAEVPRFRGRVLVLADAHCFSACEDFVGSLKGNPNVTVVGDTTGGSTGQPVFLRWENRMSARVSARRLDLPDGTPFEGRGVAPDVYAAPTAEQMARGEDPVLARALELARSAPR